MTLKDMAILVGSYSIAYILFGWKGFLVWLLVNITAWGIQR